MSKYGCLEKKVDVRDYKIRPSSISLPDEYKFFVDKYAKIKNQGYVSSCTAHATSSILEYYSKGSSLSTNFIYGIRHKEFGDSFEGMYLRDACKIVKKYGDMVYADCRGNDEVPKCFSIAEESLKDINKTNRAFSNRIESYFRCDSIEDIKTALYKHGLVLASIKMYDYIFEDSIIRFDKDSEYGLHAIMIYGWNKDGFLCQNSWGTDFGDKGRFILPYSDKIEEAWCLVDYVPDDDEIITPYKDTVFDVIYKLVNMIINAIIKVFK